MGGRLQYRSKLFHVANPVIQSLAEETGEMANVSLEEGGRWVVLYNESGDRALNLGVFPGLKTPLHTHAAGKVILANLPRNRRDSILEDGLEQVTDETITDPDKLRSEFSAIRERGHAFDMDEQIKGMGEIAAPLLDDTGVLGAVAVVCPSGRLADETYRDELTRKIKEATDSISINYQYS
jgi:DNA-binding IclR family transcriptional regulator